MITLDAFLVLLAAVAVPAIYIFLVSRWIEPEYRKSQSLQKKEPEVFSGHLIRQTA